MATVDDLLTAFTDLENQAPVSCDSALQTRLSNGSRPRRLRRWILPAIAGATVIAAVAAPVAIGPRDPSSQVPSEASPPTPSSERTVPSPVQVPQVALTALSYTFAVRSIAGVISTASRTGPDYQRVEVDSTAGDRIPVGWILVYPAGGFRPDRPAGATDTRVAGRPGFAGLIPPDGPGMTRTSHGPGLNAVAWQYAPGAWAVVQSAGPPQSGVTAPTAQEIAEAVDFTSQHPVRLPAKIRYLTSGLTPRSITTTVQGPGRLTGIDFASDDRSRLGMSIEMETGDRNPGLGTAHRRGSPIALDGFTGYYDKACGSIYLVGKGVYVAVTSTEHLDGECRAPAGTSVPSLATIEKVVRGLSFAADPADTSTWFNAAEAIPTR